MDLMSFNVYLDVWLVIYHLYLILLSNLYVHVFLLCLHINLYAFCLYMFRVYGLAKNISLAWIILGDIVILSCEWFEALNTSSVTFLLFYSHTSF